MTKLLNEQTREELTDLLLEAMSATNKIECDSMKSFTLCDLDDSMEDVRKCLKKAAKLLNYDLPELPESVERTMVLERLSQ